MKKTLTLVALVLLLAAGCNKAAKNNQNQDNQQNQGQQSTTENLPQGNKTGWNSYTSPTKYGFSIQYPNDFGFNTDVNKIKSLSYIPTCDDTTVGCVFYAGDKYKGTNFEGAGVSVNILSDLNTEAKCYNFNVSTNEAQTPANDVRINDVIFKSATGGQGAAGHFVKTQVYRNFHNNTCYEVAQRVSYTNIDNYPAGTVKQFNQDEVWNNLKQIVSTFKFTNSSSDVGTTNYSGQYETNYEGYITKFSYGFSYPTDRFTVSKSGNSVTLAETSGNRNTLKIMFYSNDALGASTAEEFWNAVKICSDCKQISNKSTVTGSKETVSFAKGNTEYVVFSSQNGGNYVVLKMQAPDAELRNIIKTLSVSTELIKPSGAGN